MWDTYLGTNEVSDLLGNAGVRMMRYPGGSYGDIYHWETHTAPGGFIAPNTDFDTFMAGVRRAGAQAIVIANYGTGSAEEAAGWVRQTNVVKRLVGPQQALEWVMTGRVFPADEAFRGRLVRSIHKPDELLPAAYALAREIADNTAPVSVALNRQMLWKMLGADHPMEAHKVDSKGIYARGKSADVKEGVTAFLEKRPARFPMKVSDGMPSYFPWWRERPFK